MSIPSNSSSSHISSSSSHMAVPPVSVVDSPIDLILKETARKILIRSFSSNTSTSSNFNSSTSSTSSTSSPRSSVLSSAAASHAVAISSSSTQLSVPIDELERNVRNILDTTMKEIITPNTLIPDADIVETDSSLVLYKKFGASYLKYVELKMQLLLLRNVTIHVMEKFQYGFVDKFVATSKFGIAGGEEVTYAIALKCYELGLSTLLIMIDKTNLRTFPRFVNAFPIILIGIQEERFKALSERYKDDRIVQILSNIGSGICVDPLSNQVFQLAEFRERGQQILRRAKFHDLKGIRIELAFDLKKKMRLVPAVHQNVSSIVQHTWKILLDMNGPNHHANVLSDSSRNLMLGLHKEQQRACLIAGIDKVATSKNSLERLTNSLELLRKQYPQFVWKKNGMRIWTEGTLEDLTLVKNDLESICYKPSIQKIENKSSYVCMLSVESPFESPLSSTSTTVESKVEK